ncbi:MAG: sensor N-terminal transmembrane domain-containing protein [Rhodospirillales bacterium]|nr:MAG: sensor N-terminal transmembrane domain-containing protein [Rhodospirillales bacterium]
MTAELGWDDAGVRPDGAAQESAPEGVKAEPRRQRAPKNARTGPVGERPVKFGGVAGRASRSHSDRLLSPLTRKILGVNMFALIIPVVGLLYLGAYRDSLIEAELEALKTQGEVFAGAIGEGAIATTLSGDQTLDIAPARQIVTRLSDLSALRARLFLPNGELAADSRLLIGGGVVVEVQVLEAPDEPAPFLEPLIRILDWLPRRRDLPPYREAPTQFATDYVEVLSALNGDVANMLRLDPSSQEYVLTVSVPVQRYRQVLGALMISKGGAEIDRAVRSLRLDVLKLFAGALVITTLLSFYLAGTIARPVRRLAAAAERVRRDIGRQTHPIPDLTHRRDEIGDLSGSFRAMTEELQAQLDAIERFAADVSHELKNPLTSLRSAVETAARVKNVGQREQLLAIVEDDVRRLDRLITDISDASRLDAELNRAQAQTVDLAAVLSTLADIHNATGGDTSAAQVVLGFPPGTELLVSGMEDRLFQVFQNLIVNAVSFSPPNGKILVTARRDGSIMELLVEDEGPGIPGNKLEAIFERFYSERPSAEKFGTHSGLGLSISKQIVEAHGGTIRAENVRADDDTISGARFIVRLPVASASA